MKAFLHTMPEDQVEKGENAKKIVVILAKAQTDKPAYVTLWIDKKKPKVFYFQPVLDFRETGKEMKKTFQYSLLPEHTKFIIRDLFKGEKSQFMYLYEHFYNF